MSHMVALWYFLFNLQTQNSFSLLGVQLDAAYSCVQMTVRGCELPVKAEYHVGLFLISGLRSAGIPAVRSCLRSQ